MGEEVRHFMPVRFFERRPRCALVATDLNLTQRDALWQQGRQIAHSTTARRSGLHPSTDLTAGFVTAGGITHGLESNRR
jgi:hypothetical protein